MNSKISHTFKNQKKQLNSIIENFDNSGEIFGDPNRNIIKLFELNNQIINIKSFKKPNLLNKIIYRFFRKSKAQRSFEYANKLTKLNIGTPQPIAYFEKKSLFFLKESYYISEHLDCDLTYRELVENSNYPNHEDILRQFTRFTYKLHENNICFLDHSPGNTLIKKNGENYNFYLVDLNRMHFKTLSFKERMVNFSRLTPKKEMVAIMSDEYAKLINENYTKVYTTMWHLTVRFQEKYFRKKRLKQKYLGGK